LTIEEGGEMVKYCSRCGNQLSFRNSFVWEKQPICRSCLDNLEQVQTEDRKVNAKEKKRLLGLPSWGLSLIVAITTLIFTIFLAHLLGSIFKGNENITQGIAYVTWALLIAIACFVICKNNPKSIWYVPILCNICGIISAIVEPNFWTTELWIFICGGWILSAIGAISGATVGNRTS
jgi:hypothetical protein